MVIDLFDGEYRFLSNFWPSVVHLDGVAYPSVENAYQAAKTVFRQRRERFLACTPGQAKRLGIILRPDWEAVKVGIMCALVQEKFTKHADLTARLLATEDRQLVEGNTWHDTFWGRCDCKNHKGFGENMLGIILMDVRTELRRT